MKLDKLEGFYREDVANYEEIFVVGVKKGQSVSRLKEIHKDEKEFVKLLKNKEGKLFDDLEGIHFKEIKTILSEYLNENLDGNIGYQTKITSTGKF